MGVTFFEDSVAQKREIGSAIIVTESNQVHGLWYLQFDSFKEQGGRKFGDSFMEGWDKMLLCMMIKLGMSYE